MEYKRLIVQSFNDIFEQVLHHVMSLHPEDPHILAGYTGFRRSLSVNDTLLIKAWYKWVYLPYKEDFDHGGVEFFLQKNYEGDVDGTAHSAWILQTIEHIRAPLQTMAEPDKIFIKTKLAHLNKLSSKWNEMFSK